MFTKLKKLRLITLALGFCALVAAMAIPCRAQVPTFASQTLFTGYTLGVLLNTNLTNSPMIIDCHKQATLAVSFTQSFGVTGTSNVVYNFHRSVDGVNFDTIDYPIAIAGTGTTPITVVTNIPVLGCGYIQLYSITNQHGTATTGFVTNMAVRYAVKISAP